MVYDEFNCIGPYYRRQKKIKQIHNLKSMVKIVPANASLQSLQASHDSFSFYIARLLHNYHYLLQSTKD